VTMVYVPKEQMNNASGIFNLLRNLGGSFGVAFVTTLLARRGQFHQHRLIDHLTLYSPNFEMNLDQLKTYLGYNLGTLADQSELAREVIYREIQREAAALSFNDVFYAQTVIFLTLVCIVWIIRKPPVGKRATPGGH